MTTALIIAAAWLTAGLPLGVLTGRAIAAGHPTTTKGPTA